MDQLASEIQVSVSVIVAADARPPAEGREPSSLGREPISKHASPAQSSDNTQCFICSRLYFGQHLQRCPHCNSESLLYFPTADLDHFARDPVSRPSASNRWVELEEQVLR